MQAYYNDVDEKACAWTRELIAVKEIPDGIVDCRSITDIEYDLSQFTHAHFFNGISGWAKALDLAGWPRDRSVWCASLPCQSFSAAGKQKGFDDERGQLWHPFLALVRKYRPLRIFGEQVKAAIGFGWLDRVRTDLEKEGYVFGAAVLGAHSAGAPHIRQRIFFTAIASGHSGAGDSGLANSNGGESSDGELQRGRGLVQQPQDQTTGGLGDTHEPGPQGRVISGDGAGERVAGAPGLGFWDDYELIPCADGKERRVESKTQCLVASVSRGVVPGGDPGVEEAQNSGEARVMRLRGYGNSITVPVAAQFIRAVMGV